MKVTITHGKAPWPEGAKVGDIVEFNGDKLPGWALGKCTPAPDDAKAKHMYEPPASDGTPQSLDEAKARIAELEKQLAEGSKNPAKAGAAKG